MDANTKEPNHLAKDSALDCTDRCPSFYRLYPWNVHRRRRILAAYCWRTTITGSRLPASFPFRAVRHRLDNRVLAGRIGRIDKSSLYDDSYHHPFVRRDKKSYLLLCYVVAQFIVHFVLVLPPIIGTATYTNRSISTAFIAAFSRNL